MSNSINANRPLPQLPSVPNHGNMAQTPTGAHPATGAIVTQIPPSPSPLLSPSPMPEMPPGRAFVASNASRSASNFQKLLANQSKKRKSDVRESARASARNEWKRRTQPNRPTNHNMLGTVVGRAKLGLISGGGIRIRGSKCPFRRCRISPSAGVPQPLPVEAASRPLPLPIPLPGTSLRASRWGAGTPSGSCPTLKT
jgi:hypothetical protein